ncbi:MAG: fumarylacetoacetate hydrolase family protein [Vulcanimicrobiaceae bacterium]
MKLARFEFGGATRLGRIEGEWVHPLPPRFASLEAYLALEARERGSLASEPALPLAEVRLRAPVSARKNVVCVGRNYLGHAEEIARARGTPLNLPAVPTFFTKASTAIADPGATLSLSAEISHEYDWEAELAVVIGTRCRDVPEADALGVVFGYTALNDLTARDLQRAHQQWFKGKSLDGCCPVGPWIVTADELGDPQGLALALRLNGETKQSSTTAQMIFSVAKIVAALSRGMTLEAGDLIATGTPDGVGMARTPPEFLRDGDLIEIEIEKIGILRNAVALGAGCGPVAAGAPAR